MNSYLLTTIRATYSTVAPTVIWDAELARMLTSQPDWS